MHIIVCIKQVPDTADVKINPQTHTLVREGVRAIVNPFDLYAVEEALRLREKFGGRVTAISMGPPQAEQALREVLAMGVDEAKLLSDRAFAGSDTWATSYTLAMAIRRLGGAAVILFGKQAADGDTAQVGPGVAAHLDLPQITYVRRIVTVENGGDGTPPSSTMNVAPNTMPGAFLVAERMLENGFETVRTPLPCVLTVVREINDPRLPSLAGVLRARQAPVPRWGAQDLAAEPAKLGLDGSPTRVVRIFPPKSRMGGVMLEGSPATVVAALAQKLKDAGIESSRGGAAARRIGSAGD